MVDLGSVNGTWITNPGKEPVRVRPHEPQTILLGAVVQLSDVVSFRVEAPS